MSNPLTKQLCLLIGLVICLFPLRAQTEGGSSYKEVKGKISISRFNTLDKPSTPEGIFLNALLWGIERLEQPKNEEQESPMQKRDFEKKQFDMETMLENPKTASRYRFILSVKVADNILSVTASDITFETETAVIKLVKRLNFEKLQPEKKPKHKEYLDEFAVLCNEYMDKLVQAVSESTPPMVKHWQEINGKEVVKGMTEAECLLSMGKPASIQRQGTKTEWMYDSYTYLFFEDGVLASFIK